MIKNKPGDVTNTPPGNSYNTEHQYTYINGLGFLPETPQLAEKKQLIMQYNVLLFSVLLLFFLRVVSFLPVINVLSVLNADVTINRMTGYVTMSETANQLANIVVYLIYMLLPAFVLLFFSKKQITFKKLFAHPNHGSIIYGIGIIAGTSISAQALVYVFQTVIRKGGVGFIPQDVVPPSSFSGFILFILSMTILPALAEEFLFRGVILRSLRRFGDLIAIAVSTVLYMLVQQRADNMIFTFVMGLVLSYFTLKTGSIIVPIVGSFMVKSIGLFFWFIARQLPPQQSALCIGLIVFLILGVSLLLFVRFAIKDTNAFKLYSADTFLTNRAKMKLMLSNLGFWLACILAFLNMWELFQFYG